MNYYKGLAIPEHKQNDNRELCCSSSIYDDDVMGCVHIVCSDCLLYYEKEFQDWLAAGRPAEEGGE